MSYMDKNLLPDERILFRTQKHLIIFFFPAVWTLLCVAFVASLRTNPVIHTIAWVPWLLAFVFWLKVWLEYITSEFAVTNKRVMMREGFFYRHTNEMRLTAISQVNVDQSLVGQLLNYGVVSINAFGAFDAYTLISQPYLFQKFVNEQLDQVAK
jgi:uncharacterized membrane protein YdbT with pleckstrin-like domain